MHLVDRGAAAIFAVQQFYIKVAAESRTFGKINNEIIASLLWIEHEKLNSFPPSHSSMPRTKYEFKTERTEIYSSSYSCVLLFLFPGEMGSNILMAGHLSAVFMTFTVHFQSHRSDFDFGDHRRLITVFVLFTLAAAGSAHCTEPRYADLNT